MATRKWKEAVVIARRDEDLSKRSSLGTGGKAEYFAEPRSIGELHGVLHDASDHKLAISVLGAGTRTIIPDEGVKGLVISTAALKGLREQGAVLTCSPGESLDNVINFAIDHQLQGLGSFGGYPGTVGGAVAMDAEAHGFSLRSFLLYADFLTAGGSFIRRRGKDFRINPKEIVTSLTFRLKPFRYTAEARMRKERFLEEIFIPPCPRYAGNVFKNPEAPELLKAYNLTGPNGTKAEFSTYQPGYIFTYPGCTSKEVLDLIHKAETAIPDKLVRAVTVLGRPGQGDA